MKICLFPREWICDLFSTSILVTNLMKYILKVLDLWTGIFGDHNVSLFFLEGSLTGELYLDIWKAQLTPCWLKLLKMTNIIWRITCYFSNTFRITGLKGGSIDSKVTRSSIILLSVSHLKNRICH